MNETNDGYFPITSVHRTDLEERGFDSCQVDDWTMMEIAAKMENAYLENGCWKDLAAIADDLGIAKRKNADAAALRQLR